MPLRSWNAVWHHHGQTADNLDTARHLEFGGFRLDRGERLLYRDGQLVPLTPKATHILLVLVDARGRLVTKEALMKTVWPETFVEEGNLAFNIHTLRKTLSREDEGPERFIETVRARGYRFIAEVRESAGSPRPEAAAEPVPAAADTAPAMTDASPAAVQVRTPVSITRWGLFATITILGVGAITVFTAFPGLSWTRHRDPRATLVRLTDDLADDRSPDVSPDGRYIAFATNRDGGKNEIYVMDADGGNLRKLTNDPAASDNPAWSADGRRIAFSTDRSGSPEVWVMNADGSRPHRVAAGTRPAWSPDGRSLVYDVDVERRHPELFVVPSAGGTPRRLTFDREFNADPSWSPDGQWIAFSSRKNAKLEVHAIHPDGTGRKTLSSSAGDDRLPMWSPDGRRILFNSTRGGKDSLFLMEADGTAQRRVTGGTTDEDEAAWCPDGRSIVFESQRDGNSEIYWMRLPGDPDGAVRLTDHPASDDFPDWSPDGSWIAFESNRDGKSGIYVMDPAGRELRRVTAIGPIDRMPSWSPDATKIAFASDREGSFAIYVMNADGSGVKRVSDGGGDLLPRWSRDGREICFTHEGQIRIGPAGGGYSRLVAKGEGCTWDPNGKTLLFDRDDNGVREVYQLNLDTGAIVCVTRNGRGNGGARWSADGARIAFNSNSDGNIFGLFLMNADGSAQTRISSHTSFDFHPSWSPDGHWIVFGTNRDGNNEIYKVAVPRLAPGGR